MNSPGILVADRPVLATLVEYRPVRVIYNENAQHLDVPDCKCSKTGSDCQIGGARYLPRADVLEFEFIRSLVENISIVLQELIIIIIWFGDTVTVTHFTKCNTHSKVRAMSAELTRVKII